MKIESCCLKTRGSVAEGNINKQSHSWRNDGDTGDGKMKVFFVSCITFPEYHSKYYWDPLFDKFCTGCCTELIYVNINRCLNGLFRMYA